MSRYIDYDKALSFPFANGNYDKENANENFIMGCETYKEWLENQPTEELTPIIRGKWITYTYNESNGCDCWGRPEYETIIEHECSYCHSKIITSKIKVYNYCPFCGAKMEESEEEE